MSKVIKWLSKHVQRIDVSVLGVGVGVELRQLTNEPQAAMIKPPPAHATADVLPPHRGVRVIEGKSWKGEPRDMDLVLDGKQVQFHIHDPGEKRTPYWVNKEKLQSGLNGWTFEPGAKLTVDGQNSKKGPMQVEFTYVESGEIGVQTKNWYVHMPIEDLRIALNEIGVRLPV